MIGFACSVFPEHAELPENVGGRSGGESSGGVGGDSGGSQPSGGSRSSGGESAGGAGAAGANAGTTGGVASGAAGSAGSAGAGGLEGGDGGGGDAGRAGGAPHAGAGAGGIGEVTGTGGIGETGGVGGAGTSGGQGGRCSTPTTVVVPAAADTYLNEAKNQQQKNFGSETRLLVSGEVDARARAIVNFELSSLTGASTLESAQLRLVLAAPAAGQHTVSLYRVGREWQEDKATWVRASTSPIVSWTLPGGDTALVASASQPLADAAAGAIVTFDVTADLTALVASGQPGYGWLLDEAMADAALELSSRESLFVEERPQLVLELCP